MSASHGGPIEGRASLSLQILLLGRVEEFELKLIAILPYTHFTVTCPLEILRRDDGQVVLVTLCG